MNYYPRDSSRRATIFLACHSSLAALFGCSSLRGVFVVIFPAWRIAPAKAPRPG
jgi:hypothetical protein